MTVIRITKKPAPKIKLTIKTKPTTNTPTVGKDLRKHALSVQKDLIITPRLMGHLATTDQQLVSPQHMDRILELLRSQHTRAQGWHPSALYSCQRSQVFTYIGMPANDSKISHGLSMIFLDGHWRHLKWQATLLAAGVLSAVEVPVRHKLLKLVGTMDGLGFPYGMYPEWIWELKGTSQFDQVKKYGALPAHKQQLHGYFVAYDKTDTGVIFYEDKATNDTHEVLVRRDHRIEQEIRVKLHKLNSAVAAAKLPEVLDECRYGEGAYKQCAYAYACKQVRWDEAQAASACKDHRDAITTLGLARRNTHDKAPAPSSEGGRGNPVTVRFASRVGRVSGSPVGKKRPPVR